jgi:hypothetical protein
MNMILPFLAIAVAIGLLAIIPIYIISQERKANQQLVDIAQARGWSIAPHPTTQRAFIFRPSESGDDWQLELYRSSSHQAALTIWKSKLVGWGNDLVLISTRLAGWDDLATQEGLPPDALAQLGGELFTRTNGWGAMPSSGPWGMFKLGITPADLTPLEAGSAAFRSVYGLLGNSPSLAEHLLNPEVETLLLRWVEAGLENDTPMVIANQAELSVRLPNDEGIQRKELLDELVALGSALTQAAQQDHPY